jgi:AraC family transcriptional activator of pobA
MTNTPLYRIKSVSEYHRIAGLPKPEHPLISVVNFNGIKQIFLQKPINVVSDLYSISLKHAPGSKFKYGQQQYDCEEGVMFFLSPNQVFGVEPGGNPPVERSGYILLVHPDFLWDTSLAKTIKQYDFFDYSINEALFLSEKEEATINSIVENIKHEYHSNIDKFSKSIMITHLENLLSYADRFYNRQFITRGKSNHQILQRLEELLTNYFDGDDLITKGLPTVQFIAEQLNVSPKYLSGMLRTLTGHNAQQHIHDKLIEKAKEKLSTTNLSVSEIAYLLGFEHSQSFSRLFKAKSGFGPSEFRASFN